MGTSNIAFERVQALLRINSGKGSLHPHLCRVIRQLVDEKPEDALATLELASRHLKQCSDQAPPAPDLIVAAVPDPEAEAAKLKYCDDVMKLIAPPTDPTSTPEVLTVVRNFMDDAAMFEWAGVGFGKEASYRLAMSLRALAANNPYLKDLCLWGKILGTDGDYYIAEGTVPKSETPPPVPDVLTPEDLVEPRGEGANSRSYWVCPGGCAPWVQLPQARSDHIVAAKSIKRLMTGDLSSQVLSTPWFPGEEQHLLRAQIARISAACVIAPSNWYEVVGEDGYEIKEVDDPIAEFPKHEQLIDQSTWVHSRHYLHIHGKTKWRLPEEYPKDTQAYIDAEEAVESDPAKPILTTIQNDYEELKALAGDGAEGGGSLAWSVKVFGDTGIYKFEENNKSNQVTAVRSLAWPGAVTVAQGVRFANIYIGYGMKCGSLLPQRPSGEPLPGTSPFLPLCPDEVMEETGDLELQPEPFPQEDEGAADDGEEFDEENATGAA